jgi:hypothetical protein
VKTGAFLFQKGFAIFARYEKHEDSRTEANIDRNFNV